MGRGLPQPRAPSLHPSRVPGLKNFDLVLVLKDFTQKPLQINSINMEHLEPLKSWLDSCNIKFYEGTANLNWNSIMKHVNDIGLEGFYDDGGWKFLNMQGSSDDEEGESDAARRTALKPPVHPSVHRSPDGHTSSTPPAHAHARR